MKDVLKIALGITLGLSITAIGWFLITAYIAKTAAEQIIKTSQQATQKQREKQASIQVVQQKKLEQEQQYRQNVLNLQISKNKAWDDFFKKSPECENPPTMREMSECVNVRMRAQRQFDNNWNATH